MEVEPQIGAKFQKWRPKIGGKTSNGGHNPQMEVEPQVEAQKWRQNFQWRP